MLVIPTVHLAAFLHASMESKHGDVRGLKPITDAIRADYAKAYQISREGITHEEHLICLLPNGPVNFLQYYEAAKGWLNYWLVAKPPLAVDVESTSLEYAKCKLHSIALAEGAPNNVAVAFPLLDLRLLPEVLERELLHLVALILADEKIVKVFHNAAYDMAVLDRKGLPVCGSIEDTMGLHHLVQPDIPHNLGFVGHTYLQVGPWKLEYKSNEGYGIKIKDYWKLLIYNAKDALYTAQLVPELKADIYDRGMSDELIYWQNSYAELSREMEKWGLPINLKMRRRLAVEHLKEILTLQRNMRDYLDWPDFNPMSTAHKMEALFGPKYAQDPWKLGLVPTMTTKKEEAPSTSYKAIIDHIEHRFVAMLVTYIEERHAYGVQFLDTPDEEVKKLKEIGASLEDLADGLPRGDEEETDPEESLGPEDISQELKRAMKVKKCGAYSAAIVGDKAGEYGRLHCKWKPHDVKSVRQSSSPNVQNIRELDRKMFEAPDGWMFGGGDQEQLELRLIAARSNCKTLLDVIAGIIPPDSYFSKKIDPHTFATVEVFGKEWWLSHGAKEREQIRKVCKNVEFGGFYLAGPHKIWQTARQSKRVDMELRRRMELSLVEGIHRSLFHGLFHEIYEWHEKNIKEVQRLGYMEIPPFGRRRYSPLMPPPATEFANYSIQCVGAEYVTSAMCRMMWAFRKFKGEVQLNGHFHDQCSILMKKQHRNEVKAIFDREFGRTPIECERPGIFLTAGFSEGPSLYDTK